MLNLTPLAMADKIKARVGVVAVVAAGAAAAALPAKAARPALPQPPSPPSTTLGLGPSTCTPVQLQEGGGGVQH
jgi:hypothetical protein